MRRPRRLWVAAIAALAVGELSGSTALAASTTTYTYDPLGQMSTSSRSSQALTYSYDAAGSRVSTVTGPTKPVLYLSNLSYIAIGLYYHAITYPPPPEPAHTDWTDPLRLLISPVGKAPFTYTWVKDTDTGATVTTISFDPANPQYGAGWTTDVDSYAPHTNYSVYSTWHCVVTDANSQSSQTPEISVVLNISAVGG